MADNPGPTVSTTPRTTDTVRCRPASRGADSGGPRACVVSIVLLLEMAIHHQTSRPADRGVGGDGFDEQLTVKAINEGIGHRGDSCSPRERLG